MNLIGPSARLLAQLDTMQFTYIKTPFPAKVFTCPEVAKITNLVESAIGKAMVVGGDKGYAIALLPGPNRLDVKKFKELMNWKKAYLANADQVKKATGLEVGAITPLIALERGDIPVVVDQALLKHEKINISSGDHELGLTVDSKGLCELLNITKQGDISQS